jgi:hypothetical protein
VIPSWTELPDPFSPEHIANPYPYYRQLREIARVHITRGSMPGFSWHADCSAILRNHNWGRIGEGRSFRADVPVTEQRSFAQLNPPDHTRLRGLVAKAFTARTVAELRPRIEKVVDRLLDRAAERGALDVVTELARPLPVAVICGLLGVPEDDFPMFADWCAAANQGLDRGWAITEQAREEQLKARRRALRKLRDYLAELVEQRRSAPQDDLMSQLVLVSEDSDRLSTMEVVMTCRLLLIGGFETTASMIGNGMLALLNNDDQRALLAEDQLPEGGSWVDELVRFDGPAQLLQCVALEPIEYEGIEFNTGDHVELLIGSGNHDPAVFDDPDRLDLTRAAASQLGFGLGTHYCLGAPLARLEAEIALGALVRRWPTMSIAGEIIQRPLLHMRGFDQLPVRLA